MSDLRRPPEVVVLAARAATGVLPARAATPEEPPAAAGVRAVEHVVAAGRA